jgi:5-formyltetrahydrofolate cyclo-ligase
MGILSAFLRAELHWSSSEASNWPVPWAAYFPIGSELDLLGHGSMNSCWLPVVEPKKRMSWFRWHNEINSWNTDTLGLPIPPPSTELCALGSTPDTPRIIVTPCLAVDKSGTRLGYGGGYYDRLIHEFHDQIFTVACAPEQLCFNENELPRMAHDMPVDLIVTETGYTLLSRGKLERVLGR